MEERSPCGAREAKSRLARGRHCPRRKKKRSTDDTEHPEQKRRQKEISVRAPRSPKKSAPSPKPNIPKPKAELPADLSSKPSAPSVVKDSKPRKKAMPA